jgi:putative membrane protein
MTETNAFQVVKVSPTDGLSGLPSGYGSFVYNPIVVTFNRPLESISSDDVTAGRILLLDESLTPVEISVYGSSTFLDIRPKWNLKNATVYTIRINGIRDSNGNVLPAVFESRFITWGNPEVVATLPNDRATDVPVNQPVFVYFDKPLNPGTINSIAIKDSNGNKVSTSVGYIPAGSGIPGFLIGLLITLIILGILVRVVLSLIFGPMPYRRYRRWSWDGTWGQDAQDILDQRYARGEITREQYNQMMEDLRRNRPPNQ